MELAVTLDKAKRATDEARLAHDIALAALEEARAEEQKAHGALEVAVRLAATPSPFSGIVEAAEAVRAKRPLTFQEPMGAGPMRAALAGSAMERVSAYWERETPIGARCSDPNCATCPAPELSKTEPPSS